MEAMEELLRGDRGDGEGIEGEPRGGFGAVRFLVRPRWCCIGRCNGYSASRSAQEFCGHQARMGGDPDSDRI